MIYYNKIAKALLVTKKALEDAPKNAKGKVNGRRISSIAGVAKAAIMEAGEDEMSARSMVIELIEPYKNLK